MNVTEITIPVPWGHIAGKTWGDKSHPPVLCLHGIIDNCNSFDRLIPLLPSCFFYICPDLPGHGRSSHYPAGFLNNPFMFVDSVTRCVNHFDLAKSGELILLCHSFGAMLGSMYAALFPDKVAKLIMMDSLGFCYYDCPLEAQRLYKESLLIPLKVEHARATKSQPKYKYEDLVQRMIAGRRAQYSSLSKEAAEILVDRNVLKVPDEDLYFYTVDQHLKHYDNFSPWITLKQLMSLYSAVEAKVMILLSSESHRKHCAAFWLDLRSVWKKLGARIYDVQGNHDVHLNEPERIREWVTGFLLESDAKLKMRCSKL